jgi:transglutaminase-like putative cysteine protease
MASCQCSVQQWHNTTRMTILNVNHKTTYRYRRPVTLGEHRLMCRPRDSHDLRLIDTTLVIAPPSTALRWMHDVFGNSIAIATFGDDLVTEVLFESSFRAQHYPSAPQAITVEPYATQLPFGYSSEEAVDLGPMRERHYSDPERKVDHWAWALMERIPERRTLDVLSAMAFTIKEQFRYAAREEAGVQTPLDTLRLKSGSCRDFAVFMMEAARSLGLAARFVSGYLYDERLVGKATNAGSLVGGGSTHAWADVYLPGAGWVEIDPTNALVGGRNLIRVAVARDASQAAPLVGTFGGSADDFESMSVAVTVTAE